MYYLLFSPLTEIELKEESHIVKLKGNWQPFNHCNLGHTTFCIAIPLSQMLSLSQFCLLFFPFSSFEFQTETHHISKEVNGDVIRIVFWKLKEKKSKNKNKQITAAKITRKMIPDNGLFMQRSKYDYIGYQNTTSVSSSSVYFFLASHFIFFFIILTEMFFFFLFSFGNRCHICINFMQSHLIMRWINCKMMMIRLRG